MGTLELQTWELQGSGHLRILKTRQEHQVTWVRFLSILFLCNLTLFLAPEVMCRQNHCCAVDYFALGVIGYEFMLGRVRYF